MDYIKHLIQTRDCRVLLKMIIDAYQNGKATCPFCLGEGHYVNRYDNIGNPVSFSPCSYCNGKGEISFNEFMRYLSINKESLLDEIENITILEDDPDDIIEF